MLIRLRELSLNVLDIAQNSIVAGASLIEIYMNADGVTDTLTLIIADNGSGMTPEQVRMVTDPFYTTRTTRKIGLGIPLFKMAAEMSGGALTLRSSKESGTEVTADFGISHVDRMPAGDFAGTVCSLIHMNPERDFIFTVTAETAGFTVFFELDTRVIKETLDGVSIAENEIALWLAEYVSGYYELLAGLFPEL